MAHFENYWGMVGAGSGWNWKWKVTGFIYSLFLTGIIMPIAPLNVVWCKIGNIVNIIGKIYQTVKILPNCLIEIISYL
jgi:hypothetical protein